MIVDAHCHAWRFWPYQPPVPDAETRGIVEQLIFEMDQGGVDRAAIVCARLAHNAENNDYIAERVRHYPERLYQFADVDCMWMDTYHAPGAADRLAEAIERYCLRGFTHYVRADDDGRWLLSAEGMRFFGVADERNQVVSLAIPWRLQPVLRELAARFPRIPFLCHHLGGARLDEPASLQQVLASANLPNIWVKVSGFHYASQGEYPFSDCAPIIRALYERFGPNRLCWGSDYPVVRRAMTYRQSLDALRLHAPFIPDDHMALVLGHNLHSLLTPPPLARARPAGSPAPAE